MWIEELLAKPDAIRALAALALRDAEFGELAAAAAELRAATDTRDRGAALVRRRRTELADAHVDRLLDAAYTSGRLIAARDPETGAWRPSPREERLRKIALGAGGIDQLAVAITALPIVVPIGRRPVNPADPTPRAETLAVAVADDVDANLVAIATSPEHLAQLRAERLRIANRRNR